MADEHRVDVAIVGAGLSGLTAAYRLSAAGASVLVLEARDRVGGRTLSTEIGDARGVDMGGRFVGVSQDAIYALAGELGVATFPTYVEGEAIAIFGDRRYRYGGEFPRMNPVILVDIAQTVARLDRLAASVPLERPWEARRADELDGRTLEGWLRSTAKTTRAREVLSVYLGLVLGAEPANVSLLHALFYVHSATNFQVMSTESGGAQQDRFVEGSQAIALALAERLEGAVQLAAPVRRIVHTGAWIRIETDRSTTLARRLVVAVPPTLAARISYDPPLPADRDQLFQRLPQGRFTSVTAVYDEPFWRRDGLSGVAWSPDLPVSAAMDNSPPDGSPGILAGFMKGEHARRLGREEPETRRKIVLDCLAEYHGSRAASPSAYRELDWAAEPWTRGCPGALFAPGVWTQFGSIVREPVGLIHWAGTETSSVWNGYMEGAVRSGARAANEILPLLG